MAERYAPKTRKRVGRPRKTWGHYINKDLKGLGLGKETAMDRLQNGALSFADTLRTLDDRDKREDNDDLK